MLTTSRNTVLVDEKRNQSNFANLGTQAKELPAATTSYYAAQNTDSEYSLDEITRKILGEGLELPPEYDEALTGATPTFKTLNSVDESIISRSMFYQEKETPVVKTHALSTKQVRIVASVFAVIVLALAIVIAFSAASASAAFANTVALEGQYASQLATVEDLATQLAIVDEAQIIEMALSQGLNEPSATNTMQYVQPEMRAAQNFAVPSNWFDNLCDFISQIFGG